MLCLVSSYQQHVATALSHVTYVWFDRPQDGLDTSVWLRWLKHCLEALAEARPYLTINSTKPHW